VREGPALSRYVWAFVLSASGLAIGACASGGRAFPTGNEAVPHAVGRAMAAIADAVAAGADSLAFEPLKLARQRLAAATTEEQAKHADRAGLFAREAIADASYAKAVAERITADRARAAAAAQLNQVSAGTSPGPGAQR
jgi:hypothetical protein